MSLFFCLSKSNLNVAAARVSDELRGKRLHDGDLDVGDGDLLVARIVHVTDRHVTRLTVEELALHRVDKRDALCVDVNVVVVERLFRVVVPAFLVAKRAVDNLELQRQATRIVGRERRNESLNKQCMKCQCK